MLKSIESKKEAEIYECLSHDESFIMSDLENLGPWHKYGSSIHQELKKISRASHQKSASEHHLQNNSSRLTRRRLTQELLKQIPMPLNTAQIVEPKSRTQLTKLKSSKEEASKQDKSNIGFFVQCYPKYEARHRAINYQSSKEYFEKIALKMLYGIERKSIEPNTIQNNSTIVKKELKFQKAAVNNNSSFVTKPQNYTRTAYHKFINKKTVVSFASQNQLLVQQYQKSQKIHRMVSS